ncbi:MAG TPA: hypothetical protein VIY48_06755 [Candidatus Paceibacterota bacterium]
MSKVTLELSNKNYWLAMFCCTALDEDGEQIGDIMFGMYRPADAEGSPLDNPHYMWELEGRLRIQVDNKIWGSDDEKHWTAYTIGPMTEEQALKSFRSWCNEMANEYSSPRKKNKREELLFQCLGEEAGHKMLLVAQSGKSDFIHAATHPVGKGGRMN